MVLRFVRIRRSRSGILGSWQYCSSSASDNRVTKKQNLSTCHNDYGGNATTSTIFSYENAPVIGVILDIKFSENFAEDGSCRRTVTDVDDTGLAIVANELGATLRLAMDMGS